MFFKSLIAIIFDMNCLSKILKNKKHIVFIDLEGTQINAEMIAFGALRVDLNANYTIKKYYQPFKRLVKCDKPVGKIVEELTGLNNKTINRYGVSFEQTMIDFKKYCGEHFSSSIFCSFGHHDLRIIAMTLQAQNNVCLDICEEIFSNHVDFLKIISEFIKDNEGSPYSLINYCKIFNVKLKVPAHDPEADAINLARLYDTFLKNKQTIFEEYKKTLSKDNHTSVITTKLIHKLNRNETITPEEYEKMIRKYIDDKLS